MRFNTGAFNRSSFNLADNLADTVYIRAVLAGEFGAHITRGVNVYMSDHLNEEIKSDVWGANGHYISANLDEQFTGKATLEARYFISETLSETFTGKTMGAIDLHIVGTLAEAFSGIAEGAKDWHVMGLLMGEEYRQKAVLSLVFYPGETKFNEVFFGMASTYVWDYLTMTVDVTLYPGSTLIIDSDRYTVTVDGQNAIYAHAGDWLYMTRDVYDVAVTTFSGRTAAQAGLNVRALYVERYL